MKSLEIVRSVEEGDGDGPGVKTDGRIVEVDEQESTGSDLHRV